MKAKRETFFPHPNASELKDIIYCVANCNQLGYHCSISAHRGYLCGLSKQYDVVPGGLWKPRTQQVLPADGEYMPRYCVWYKMEEWPTPLYFRDVLKRFLRHSEKNLSLRIIKTVDGCLRMVKKEENGAKRQDKNGDVRKFESYDRSTEVAERMIFRAARTTFCHKGFD
ncbi:hypothetical protein RRG08_006051 [Elysia crispata]|uniref:Uncharacterized protein n=1 Tax=Elysia crispata TaxID=231223 RepID=A0AAE0Z3W9_9GAST|nr:hypothetical protein RRG08_006051 [Elysia crispata]